MSHEKPQAGQHCVAPAGSNPTPGHRWRSDAALRRKRLADAIDAGGNRHLLEQTRILRDVIDPRMLQDEPDHADTRWTAYGYVSTFEATEHFTRLYVRYYERYRARYIDQDPHPCPVDPEFVLNDPGTMNALYNARQFADRLGVPYERFLMGMFERLMTIGRYRRVPLPAQLYPPKHPRKRKGRKTLSTKHGVPLVHKALRHALQVQEQELPKCDVLAQEWDRRFFANNYVGDPAQERALRALASHKTTFSQRQTLRDRLAKGRISLDNARRVFPSAVVDAALRDAPPLPAIGEPDAGLDRYRPHCLGLIQAPVPAAACGSCAWQEKCRGLADRAEDQQRVLTGYGNRKERHQAAARGRQQKSRAKKKEASGAEGDKPAD